MTTDPRACCGRFGDGCQLWADEMCGETIGMQELKEEAQMTDPRIQRLMGLIDEYAELIECRYGESGYACCEGAPCQAAVTIEGRRAAILSALTEELAGKQEPVASHLLDVGRSLLNFRARYEHMTPPQEWAQRDLELIDEAADLLAKLAAPQAAPEVDGRRETMQGRIDSLLDWLDAEDRCGRKLTVGEAAEAVRWMRSEYERLWQARAAHKRGEES